MAMISGPDTNVILNQKDLEALLKEAKAIGPKGVIKIVVPMFDKVKIFVTDKKKINKLFQEEK